MRTQIITYHLEMTDPQELRPSQRNHPDLEIKQARIPCPALNRFLYTAVGAGWYWSDRLPWTYEQWLTYLTRPEVETWVAYVAGTPAGYFELERQLCAQVELAYFGVLPQFIGQGIGGLLLTAALRRAWALGPSRVWLHTCSLDHPHALAAYDTARVDLEHLLKCCSSGKELSERGFEQDVELAAALDVSRCVPTLMDGAYVQKATAR